MTYINNVLTSVEKTKMQKIICLTLIVITMIGCLMACNITTNNSDSSLQAENSGPKVEKMMQALTDMCLSDAKKLMHPDADKDIDIALNQMMDYIDGRGVTRLERSTALVSSSVGSSNKSREETSTYRATLDDGSIVNLSVVYLWDNNGSGFMSFHLIIGII